MATIAYPKRKVTINNPLKINELNYNALLNTTVNASKALNVNYFSTNKYIVNPNPKIPKIAQVIKFILIALMSFYLKVKYPESSQSKVIGRKNL